MLNRDTGKIRMEPKRSTTPRNLAMIFEINVLQVGADSHDALGIWLPDVI